MIPTETSLIKLLLKSAEWEAAITSGLSIQDFPKELQPLFSVVDNFHSTQNDEKADLTIADLANLLFATVTKDHDYYKQLLSSLDKLDVSDKTSKVLLNTLVHNRHYKQLSLAAYEITEGRTTPEHFQSLLDGFKALGDPSTEQDVDEDTFVTDDLEQLVHAAVSQPGLRWRLNTLNRMLGSLRKGNFGFVFARPECLAKGTGVLLSDGRTINVEAIKAGMKVMGPDSTPRTVLATTVGHAPMYEISYSWGESYVCNDNHILHLECSDGRVVNIPVKEYIKQSDKFKKLFKQVKVGVELPTQDLKLDPYILGLWLGDGHSCGPIFTNMDEAVIRAVQEYADKTGLVCNVSDTPSRAKTLRLSSVSRKHGANVLTQFLKSARLYKNKHIPDKYLRSSQEQRLQLLAGLLDTDGSKGKHGYEITQVREHLADQILWLARSLGFHTTKYTKVVNETNYYRVAIYGAVHKIPVKIEYKKFTVPTTKPKQNLRFGFEVSEKPEDNYYGIYVDQDNLYVLGDFTVTHNTGKTTFLASEVTFMCTQLSDEDGPILWLANEEPGVNVKLRVYQAFFGIDLVTLMSDIPKWSAKFVKESKGKIKILDKAIIHKGTVEKLCKKYKPSLLIADQIDKITGFDNDREDLRLGSIYQWFRELAKTYCPVIGICQADGTGEGVKWLTMGHVANAKTAKQAEADWILGIGKQNAEGYDSIRYLHLSKNKLLGDHDTDPNLRHGKQEALIEPQSARYKDIH